MKLDLHTHSKYSADSKLDIKAMVDAAKKKGMDGISITDHNTFEAYRSGEIKRYGRDFTIVPGEEIKTADGEVIGYYINEEIHAETLEEAIEKIKDQGGLVALPHPFDVHRCAAGVIAFDAVEKLKKKIDFIEINGRAFPEYNNAALDYARKNNIAITGGSDAHTLWEIGRICTITGDLRSRKTDVKGSSSRILSVMGHLRTKMYKVFGV